MDWITLVGPRVTRTPTQATDYAAPNSRSPEALQAAYLGAVFAYVLRRLSRREEAEDITAQVFADAFAHLDRLRRTDDPLPWLLGIARRRLADARRRQGRRPETLHSELPASELSERMTTSEGDGPQALLERRERRQEIRRLVARLPEPQREALLLQYVEDLTIAQIATVLHRSPAAVNSLLQRARAALYRDGKAYFLPEEDHTS